MNESELLLLLAKYIEHVSQAEGIDFIDRLNEKMSSDIEFTGKECTYLRFMSENAKHIIKNNGLPAYQIEVAGQIIPTEPIAWDEEAELIVQLKRNGQSLIYGAGDYPVAINGADDFFESTGLREIVMRVQRDKYFEVIKELQAMGEEKYLETIRLKQS